MKKSNVNQKSYDHNPKLAPGIRHGEMITSTGLVVDLFKPDPNLITLEDIAHGLAYTCRWNGHTKKFFSVAEHAIRVADRVPENKKLTALFHDAEEAYWGDIISPLKALLPPEIVTKIVEFRQVIFEKFRIPDICDEVDDADKAEMLWDRENLIDVANTKVFTMNPYEAKNEWFNLAGKLLVERSFSSNDI